MGFGTELKEFAAGFRQGVQIANQSRNSQVNEYRYGRPPKDEVESMPGIDPGTGTGTVTTKDPSSDTSTTSSVSAKPGEIEQYIRKSASERGIDPDIAVRVAKSEGGVDDPVRQSGVVKNGKRERSYGPFQLYLDGGLGNKALEAGIDPRNPEQWREAVDFALDNAKTSGWGQWYGAKKVGIDDWDGIGGPKRGPTSVKKGPTPNVSYDGTSASATGSGVPAAEDEDEDEDEGEPAESEPVAEEGGDEIVGSANLSFELPDVAIPEITPWTEYAQLAARRAPAMFAAKGGVIPETMYADGGQVEEPPMAPRPAVDPYNTTRSYTQQIPESGARPTFQPRRISAPVLPDRTAAGARTVSQQAWDAAKAKAAADKAAAAAAAAQPAAAAAAPVGYTDAEMRRFRQMQMLGIPLKEGTWADVSAKATPQQYTDLKMMGYGSGSIGRNGLFGQGGLRRGGSREQGGMVYHNFEEGGVVPTGFARGGAVPSISAEYWEEAVRRESRPGRSAQEARDIAAKRVNRSARDLTSSAVNIGKAPRERQGKPDRVRTKRSSTSSVEPVLPKESVGGGKESKPDTKVTPDTATPPQPKPGRLSDEYVIPDPEVPPYQDDVVRNRQDDPRGPIPMQLPDNGRERDTSVGPGVDLAIPDPTQAEPSLPPPPVVQQVGPDERSNPSRPPAVPGPGGLPGGGPGAPRLDLDAMKQMAVEAVQSGSAAALEKLREVYESMKPRIPGPVDRPPLLTIPEPEAQTGNGFMDIVPTFDDFLGMLLGDDKMPLRESGTEPPPEEGPPTDRQGRPVRQIAFARGGAVPEEDEEPVRSPLSPRLAEAGYTTSATGERSSARQPAAPAPDGPVEETPRQHANVKPTKRLRDDVAVSLDGGIKALTRLFGLGSQGAMPSPEDEPRQREGMMRLAKGEGAATPEEIRMIDDKVDPERQLSEGDRQMNRLAQTMQWYQQAGRKDEAETAAASLLQYGSQRFSKLGSMAANQYEKFQQTGDQDYLQGTINMLEQAYAMVPDGAKVDVSINSQTGDLQVSRIDAEGNEEDVPIKASDLPGIIQSVQNGSQYWKSIYRIADPAGARAEAAAERQDARSERSAERQDERMYIREGFIQDREDKRAVLLQEKEQRAKRDQIEREERAAKRDDLRWARAHPEVNWEVAQPLLTETRAAQRALSEDSEDPELRAAYNQSASRLFDAIKGQVKDPILFMEDRMFIDYDYIAPEGAPAEAPPAADAAPNAQTPAPGPPPSKYPDATWVGDHWEVTKDGKVYRLNPKAQ